MTNGHSVMRAHFLCFCAPVVLCACVRTPDFETSSGVTPNAVIDVIQCELVQARKRYEKLARKDLDWVAVADLTLQVDEQATLTPAFTHTSVLSKTASLLFDWGAKLDTQSQRVYNETVSLKIWQLKDPGPDCLDNSARSVSLNGSLGLTEIVKMAFESIDAQQDVGIEFKNDAKKSGVFGTSLQFVVVRNVNSTGPTWTLANFKGPGKLFFAQRMDTHKLTISFAGKGNVQAATMNNLKLIQQTVPSSIINQLQQQLR